MSSDEIASLMRFQNRQSDYYYNAGRYLGLFEEYRDGYGGSSPKTPLLEKKCLHWVIRTGNSNWDPYFCNTACLQIDSFDCYLSHKTLTPKQWLEEKITAYHVCKRGQLRRRASLVLGGLKWIRSLST